MHDRLWLASQPSNGDKEAELSPILKKLSWTSDQAELVLPDSEAKNAKGNQNNR